MCKVKDRLSGKIPKQIVEDLSSLNADRKKGKVKIYERLLLKYKVGSILRGCMHRNYNILLC